MGLMISIGDKGQAQEGIGLDLYVKALKAAAEKYPEMTINPKETSIILTKDAPSGWIHLTDAASVYRQSGDGMDFYMLAPGQEFRFEPDQDDCLGFIAQSTPSGICQWSNQNFKTAAHFPHTDKTVDPQSLLGRVTNWLTNGDVGSSSLYLLSQTILNHDPNMMRLYHTLLQNERIYPEEPRDVSDWARVVQLIDAVPEVMGRLDQMAEKKGWKDLLLINDTGESEMGQKIKEARDWLSQKKQSAERDRPSTSIRQIKP